MDEANATNGVRTSTTDDRDFRARFDALAEGVRHFPEGKQRQRQAPRVYADVEAEVASGRLTRGPCALCNQPAPETVPYVPDYTNPRVFWFCPPHRVWFARRLEATRRLPVSGTGALPNFVHDTLDPPCPRNCAGCGCALHAGLSVYHDERTGSDYDLACAARRIRAATGLLYVRSLGYRP
jgi:hypothetical protein